jgi:hypothetical protein
LLIVNGRLAKLSPAFYPAQTGGTRAQEWREILIDFNWDLAEFSEKKGQRRSGVKVG